MCFCHLKKKLHIKTSDPDNGKYKYFYISNESRNMGDQLKSSLEKQTI